MIRIDYRELVKEKQYIILNAFYQNYPEKYVSNPIYATFIRTTTSDPWFYNISNKPDKQWCESFIYPTKFWHFYETLEDRIERATQRMALIKDELLAVALEPHRVAKWFEDGRWGCIEM